MCSNCRFVIICWRYVWFQEMPQRFSPYDLPTMTMVDHNNRWCWSFAETWLKRPRRPPKATPHQRTASKTGMRFSTSSSCWCSIPSACCTLSYSTHDAREKRQFSTTTTPSMWRGNLSQAAVSRSTHERRDLCRTLVIRAQWPLSALRHRCECGQVTPYWIYLPPQKGI